MRVTHRRARPTGGQRPAITTFASPESMGQRRAGQDYPLRMLKEGCVRRKYARCLCGLVVLTLVAVLILASMAVGTTMAEILAVPTISPPTSAIGSSSSADRPAIEHRDDGANADTVTRRRR